MSNLFTDNNFITKENVAPEICRELAFSCNANVCKISN